MLISNSMHFEDVHRQHWQFPDISLSHWVSILDYLGYADMLVRLPQKAYFGLLSIAVWQLYFTETITS